MGGDFTVDLSLGYPVNQTVEMLFRLFLACVCGGFVGSERSKRMKPAGIRTHVLVCGAAALFMILSKYAFQDIGPNGNNSVDASRIASSILAGIGFLGAGAIFKDGSRVTGLTTATTLGCTTAIGMAFGAGMYLIGAAAAIVLIVFQYLLHRFTVGGNALYTYTLEMVFTADADPEECVTAFCDSCHAMHEEQDVSFNENGTITYRCLLRCRDHIPVQKWKEFCAEHKELLTFSKESYGG